MFSAFRLYSAIKDGEVEPPLPLPLKNLIEIDVLKTKYMQMLFEWNEWMEGRTIPNENGGKKLLRRTEK